VASHQIERDYQTETAGEAGLMPTLETTQDLERQQYVMNRVFALYKKHVPSLEIEMTQKYFGIDYWGYVNGQRRFGFEIKTRKESAQQLQRYPEGLIFRPRTLRECREHAKMLNIRVFIIFAFDSGLGEMWLTEPATYGDLEEHPPKPRRVSRGNLACDLEPMNYLSWTEHLHRIA